MTVALSVCGLPGTGKTTFLAALWGLISEMEIETELRFGALIGDTDKNFLNSITRTWREAMVQARTHVGDQHHATMDLLDEDGNAVRLTFPDLAGESYRRMWEDRECDQEIIDSLKAGSGIIFFVNSNNITEHMRLTETVARNNTLGVESGSAKEADFSPRECPTQVKIVDILQIMKQAPLEFNGNKLCLIMSLWDKVQRHRKTPAEFLAERLPMLDQYLKNSGEWEYRIYGLSAQGGDYEDDEKPSPRATREAAAIRELATVSERIQLVDGTRVSHDLTEPLVWLMK